MGHNVFMVNYAASTIVNQLDNLPVTHDPYIRVHVTYNSGSAGIEENQPNVSKELIKITDVLGRETMDGPNKTLIYMYSDGSIKKIYRLQ
jgi:hypothetical protein